MTTPSRKTVRRVEVSPSPYFPDRTTRARTQPATDPETRAFHEAIAAKVWGDKPQQADAEADRILDTYDDERGQ